MRVELFDVLQELTELLVGQASTRLAEKLLTVHARRTFRHPCYLKYNRKHIKESGEEQLYLQANHAFRLLSTQALWHQARQGHSSMNLLPNSSYLHFNVRELFRKQYQHIRKWTAKQLGDELLSC